MNRVTISGRWVKDPEVRYTQDQNAIAKGTIAVNRKGKDKGADFISVVAFGKTAEFIQKYFTKGMKADIGGHIQTGSYDGKNGKVYTTEVVIDEIEFGESKAKEEPKEEFENVSDDELPFN